MCLDIGRDIYFGQLKGKREKEWVTEMKEMWKSQVQADKNLYLPRSREWDWDTGSPGPCSRGGLAPSVFSFGHSIQHSYSKERVQLA